MRLFSDNYPEVRKSKIRVPVQFIGKGEISLDCCHIGVWPSPYFLSGIGYIEARSKDAMIRIGADSFINNNFVIIADKTSVVIGKRCLIGSNFYVVDSDFHGVAVDKRSGSDYLSIEVVIGDDVFIGEGVKIMKGVRVGSGSVVAAGSVVVSSIPANCIYGGNPAKFIRSIENTDIE